MGVAVSPVRPPGVRRGCFINCLVAVPPSSLAATLFLIGRGGKYLSCANLPKVPCLTLVLEVFQNACCNNTWGSEVLEQCFSHCDYQSIENEVCSEYNCICSLTL